MAPKKGSKRTVVKRAPLDFSAIRVSKATPETMVQHRPTRGEREAEQLQIDQIVRKAWEAWIADGKPTEWAKQPGMLATLPEDQLDTFKWRLGRSGTHYDFKIRIGSVETWEEYAEDEDGNTLFDDKDEPVKTGNRFADVVFVATDKPDTTEDDQEDSPESSDEPPTE